MMRNKQRKLKKTKQKHLQRKGSQVWEGEGTDGGILENILEKKVWVGAEGALPQGVVMPELVLHCPAVQLQMQVQEELQEMQEGARGLLLDPDHPFLVSDIFLCPCLLCNYWMWREI